MNATNTRKRGAPAANTTGDGLDFPRIFKGILLGQGVAWGLFLLLSFVAAAIAFSKDDPDSMTHSLSIAVASISALFGGLVTARTVRRQPLLCGLGSGVIFVLLGLALSCFFPNELHGNWSPTLAMGMRAGSLLFSVLGAILAGNIPGMRKKKKKTHKNR